MDTKTTLNNFIDFPDPQLLIETINHWLRPTLPGKIVELIQSEDRNNFWELSYLCKQKLGRISSVRSKTQLQKLIIEWLFILIRLNVKRGRIFNLQEVLETGNADCLGYAKVFTTLGRYCGLDMGIIEVIIDTRKRNVPHTASLVRLSSGKPQFVDFWYGSQDIRHQRLGLNIKHNEIWQVGDIDYKALKNAEDISYLPDCCVNAITLYIEGNRLLKNCNFAEAVEYYSRATQLYPENARLFYNRAVAFENLGRTAQAQADYARALYDDSSIFRSSAVQPEEIVNLINLDSAGISEQTQEMYLLAKGFITGKNVSTIELSRRFALSSVEIIGLLCAVEGIINHRPVH
jgi:hypothetical protein